MSIKFWFPEWRVVEIIKEYGFISNKDKSEFKHGISSLNSTSLKLPNTISKNIPINQSQNISNIGINSEKNNLANVSLILFFILIILPLLIILYLLPIALICLEIDEIISSGFSEINSTFFIMWILVTVSALTMLIPYIKNIYKKLPWLYMYIQVFTIDAIIVVVGVYILNKGYEIQNSERHTLFYILMMVFFLISRLTMCIYYKKNPIKFLNKQSPTNDKNEYPANDFSYNHSQYKNFYEVKKNHPRDCIGTFNETALNRALVDFGIVLLIISVIFLLIWINPFSIVDTSNEAKKAIKAQVSTILPIGTLLLDNDKKLKPQNYTIKHSLSDINTEIWVWDYAYEDGDYIKIFVNGKPIKDGFMIKNRPIKLSIPSTAVIQVKGIRDVDDDGINYAIKYDLNDVTYFNSVSVGKRNTYELVRE